MTDIDDYFVQDFGKMFVLGIAYKFEDLEYFVVAADSFDVLGHMKLLEQIVVVGFVIDKDIEELFDRMVILLVMVQNMVC